MESPQKEAKEAKEEAQQHQHHHQQEQQAPFLVPGTHQSSQQTQQTRHHTQATMTSVYSLKLMGGNSHPELLELISKRLDRPIGKVEVGKFANGETRVEIIESIREANVFLLQTGFGCKIHPDPACHTTLNDSCMELLIMAAGCKLASARRVIAVLPYFPYSKQSKQKRRGSIPSRLFCDLLKKAGVDGVLTLDLHHMQMQGFFDTPVDNIKTSPLLTSYIRDNIPNWHTHVVVSKNTGASKWAALIAKRLQVEFAMIMGEQYKYAEALSNERLDGDGSYVEANKEMEDTATPGEVDEEEASGDGVIGVVKDRHCIIVDDVVDTPKSFLAAAQLLKNSGALDITIIGTHGLLSQDSMQKFEDSPLINRVVVTNTVPQSHHVKWSKKLKVIDCSHVVSEAIRRLHHHESLYSLYTNQYISRGGSTVPCKKEDLLTKFPHRFPSARDLVTSSPSSSSSTATTAATKKAGNNASEDQASKSAPPSTVPQRHTVQRTLPAVDSPTRTRLFETTTTTKPTADTGGDQDSDANTSNNIVNV